jgi:hypothetical protein
MMMQTMFDVLRDTRMEPFAADLAWGFANSFHVVAKRIEGREDDAAKKLGDLARSYDPSEIYATELEDTQLLCQTLPGLPRGDGMHARPCRRGLSGRNRQALLAGAGKPGFQRAYRIDDRTRDYLASKARERRRQFAPEGPVVAFSVVRCGRTWTCSGTVSTASRHASRR